MSDDIAIGDRYCNVYVSINGSAIHKPSRFVLKGVNALPKGVQRAIIGKPIVIDGQELHLSTQLGLRLIHLFGSEAFEIKPLPESRDVVARQLWMSVTPVSVRDCKINGTHGTQSALS